MSADVLIVGGGVIGLTTAYELAGRGVKVTLLDQGVPGREASWAGAGILPPTHPGDPAHPLAAMCRATNALWPDLTADLREATGIDNGFRRCGGLGIGSLSNPEAIEQELDAWRQAGAVVETLSSSEISACEAAINPVITKVYRLPELAQVRNPWHLKALLSACHQRGVEIRTGVRVNGFHRSGGTIIGVDATHGRHDAGTIVVAAGAWSQELLASAGCPIEIEPVRGQIVLLSCPQRPFRHVIECGPRYLVPRNDGRVLIGSTEEWVGFNKQNTAEGLLGLLSFAEELVPALKQASFERAWAGLRPRTVNGMPFIGRVPGEENLIVAAGHFRAGLHFSPVTGRVVSQLIMRESPMVDVSPFAPTQHKY